MPDSSPPAAGDLRTLPADRVARFDAGLAPVLARYPADRKASAMIPALRLGQALFGHLTPEVMALAADRLGVSPARAEEVATFYVMFHTEPVGRHVVEVCTNVSCCLAGGERHLRADLQGQARRRERRHHRRRPHHAARGRVPGRLRHRAGHAGGRGDGTSASPPRRSTGSCGSLP